MMLELTWIIHNLLYRNKIEWGQASVPASINIYSLLLFLWIIPFGSAQGTMVEISRTGR